MNKLSRRNSIAVWQSENAPEPLRRLAGSSEWIAFIPPHLTSPDTEALFVRWHSDSHPVIRRVLPDGAVVLAGSYPSGDMMAGNKPALAAANAASAGGGAETGKENLS
jgi:hypothetical protein